MLYLYITDLSPQHCPVSIQRQAEASAAERQPGFGRTWLQRAGQLRFRAGSSD